MLRLSKAFLLFTGLLYTVFLFYVYAYFAKQEMIYLQLGGDTMAFSSNTLFYTGLIFPLVIAMVGIFFSGFFKKQSISSNGFFKNESAKKKMIAWSNGLGGVFNLFSASILSIILFSNNEEGVTQNGFIPFVFISVALIIVWFLWLPIILAKNK